jgi:hypothetical protein
MQAHAEESKVFHLQYRSAEEIIPLLLPITGKDKIAGQGQKIVITGSSKTLNAVEEALKWLDTAPKLYIVTVKQERKTFAEKPGSITYGTPSLKDESLTQTIQVLEGRAAYIALRRTLPYADWVGIFGPWTPGVSGAVATETEVNGFFIKVEPRDGLVLVELRAQFSQMGTQRRLMAADLDEHVAALTIEASLGNWVDLGTTTRQKGSSNATYRTPQKNDLQTNIAIKIEEAPISPSKVPPKPQQP